MKRLSFILAYFLISTLAYAQNDPVAPAPPSPSTSGTEGDSWLFLLVIPFIVVAAAVYFVGPSVPGPQQTCRAAG
jgi:hypothetical protein